MAKKNFIQKYILENVEQHSTDIAMLISEKFGFSRQRAHHYLAKEVKNGTLIKTGRTRWSRYFLASGKHIEFFEKIKPNLAEDIVWSKYVSPMIRPLPKNIYQICIYGFTEIFNNAIDHSNGTTIFSSIEIKDGRVTIRIMDNGIGIFKKIQNALKLVSIKEGILHLSKGKFTTDAARHTGEGIFFTSRIFDSFSILANDVYYSFSDEEWFLSPERNDDINQGTLIEMAISTNSIKTTKEVFDKYTNQEFGFDKTIVTVALSSDPNDPHISRSQAKRLLMGLEKFKIIVLNFKGIESVGQAFVDEIFRVFQNEHPEITLHYINTSDEVKFVIKRALVYK